MTNISGLPEGALVGNTDPHAWARHAMATLEAQDADPEVIAEGPEFTRGLKIGLLATMFSGAMLTGKDMEAAS